MVMISLSASPAWGPRFLAGWASWLSSRASQCGPKAWQKSSNWQKSSTSRSNMDASPHLMAPTQKEEFKGDKGLASPQTRNSGYPMSVFDPTSLLADPSADPGTGPSAPRNGDLFAPILAIQPPWPSPPKRALPGDRRMAEV